MDKPSYAISREVIDDDIDNLGHASNVAYVRWIQDIAVAHSEAVGLGYEGYARLGAVFVIRHNQIDYPRPLLRGDRVEVRTSIDSAMAAKCFRATEITRDGVVVARFMTTWGFVDASTRTAYPNSRRGPRGVRLLAARPRPIARRGRLDEPDVMVAVFAAHRAERDGVAGRQPLVDLRAEGRPLPRRDRIGREARARRRPIGARHGRVDVARPVCHAHDD